jgi:hypothetical protein
MLLNCIFARHARLFVSVDSVFQGTRERLAGGYGDTRDQGQSAETRPQASTNANRQLLFGKPRLAQAGIEGLLGDAKVIGV